MTNEELYRTNGNIWKVKASGLTWRYEFENNTQGEVCAVKAVGETKELHYQQVAGFLYALALMRREYVPSVPKNLLQYEFVGVARLKDNEVPNIELAKKIARYKALRQYYKYYSNFAKYVLAQTQKEIDKGEIFWNDIEEKLDFYNQKILEIVGGED